MAKEKVASDILKKKKKKKKQEEAISLPRQKEMPKPKKKRKSHPRSKIGHQKDEEVTQLKKLKLKDEKTKPLKEPIKLTDEQKEKRNRQARERRKKFKEQHPHEYELKKQRENAKRRIKRFLKNNPEIKIDENKLDSILFEGDIEKISNLRGENLRDLSNEEEVVDAGRVIWENLKDTASSFGTVGGKILLDMLLKREREFGLDECYKRIANMPPEMIDALQLMPYYGSDDLEKAINSSIFTILDFFDLSKEERINIENMTNFKLPPDYDAMPSAMRNGIESMKLDMYNVDTFIEENPNEVYED